MKSVLKLVVCCLALTVLSFQCDSPCLQRFYALDFLVYDSRGVYFDSIVNLSENQLVWRNDLMLPPGDSIQGAVALNPSKSSTVFSFYGGHGVDTLEINHHFVEAYRSNCDEYYFNLLSSEVVSTTFEKYDYRGGSHTAIQIFLD